jgi:hypothetical protein
LLGLVVVDVSSTVSDIVSDRRGDSDVGMRGILGVDEGILLDDGGDRGDVDSLGKGLELDGDRDGVSGSEGSTRRKKAKATSDALGTKREHGRKTYTHL